MRKTCSISSFLGTLPSSSWRATAIFALRSFFFCSGAMVAHLYQNSIKMPSFETLILKRVLIHRRSLVVLENDEDSDEFQKGTFLIPHFTCHLIFLPRLP